MLNILLLVLFLLSAATILNRVPTAVRKWFFVVLDYLGTRSVQKGVAIF